MGCIDGKEHDFEFVGYMVVADKLRDKIPQTPTIVTGSTNWSYPLYPTPLHFEAKIEVLQCRKCGKVRLQPAVFSRIFSGDKK